MGTSDMASELQKLQAEVAALQQAEAIPERESAGQASDRTDPAQALKTTATTDATEATETSATLQSSSAPAETSPEESSASIDIQLHKLATLLEDEIGELPTVTCLLVFSLGIVMGRLMR